VNLSIYSNGKLKMAKSFRKLLNSKINASNLTKNKCRLSIVVPCFGRPARTRRIIRNILNQTIDNWEAFVIGDGCPQFQEMVDSGEVGRFISEAKSRGNILHCFNLNENYGGFGYQITNYAAKNAIGEYFIFAGNDDIIYENHFEHYLSEIEETDLDLVYYNTYVAPTDSIRISKLECNHIGHSEIIIKTNLIRDFQHKPVYAHDWDFISYLLSNNIKQKKSKTINYTYIVTHLPGNSIDEID
jgi:glycosyltransferase involved in cell wall biosynthesis